MTTPGSNLFKIATRLIKPTTVQYYPWSARVLNQARQYVSAFLAPVPVKASVQAVNRNLYAEYGLNLQKKYIKVFAAVGFLDLGRDTSSDRIVWNGRLYQIDSENDWFVQDGWASCIAVDVGLFTGNPNA